MTGSNGAGKTTLLKILASLARPSAGSVRVLQGEKELSENERRLAVGWAGPDLAFYEDFTALENLRFFRRAAGWPAGESDLQDLLARVGLAEASRQRVGEFSSGMTQRLRIAFALLFDPPLLLLDEPFTALDADGRERVLGVIEEKRKTGAVLLASNDVRDFPAPEEMLELGRREA